MTYEFDETEQQSLILISEQLENLKKFDENGNEYWSVRELMPIFQTLSYVDLSLSIQRIVFKFLTFFIDVSKDFVFAFELSESPFGRSLSQNFKLSYYGCYLLADDLRSFCPDAHNVTEVYSYFYWNLKNLNEQGGKMSDFDPNSPNVRSLPQSISVDADADDLDSIFGEFQNQIRDRIRKLIAQEFNRQLNQEIPRLFDHNENTTKL